MNKEQAKNSAFERELGISFRQPELLKQALTHSSFVNEFTEAAHDNERLEFLGDAVLDLIVADMLYQKYPQVSEGMLTQLRAALVKTESLAQLGRACNIGQYLRIGHGDELSGGRERLSTLGGAFEAVIGAIYLDRGLPTAVDFLKPRLLELLETILKDKLHIDARSELQELAQGNLNITPSYRVIDSAGPDHAKEFRVEVALGESIIGQGRGRSKRSAAQAAARSALQEIDAHGLPTEIASANEEASGTQ